MYIYTYKVTHFLNYIKTRRLAHLYRQRNGQFLHAHKVIFLIK